MALSSKFALLLASLSTVVVASKVATVPVSKKIIPVNSKDLVEREGLRRASFATALASSATVPVTNADDSYIANTTVGDQAFNLIVDTGSSNTWVGAGTTFDGGDSSEITLALFTVTYGSGEVVGTEWKAPVTLGGLTATMDIGDAVTASGFDTVDGIIGFGPVDLTSGTVIGLDGSTIPTFMNTLLSSGAISEEVLGVSFAPITDGSASSQNGELTLGGMDSSKYTGSITYTPITSAATYSEYWGIDVADIDFAGTSLGGAGPAIADTGTTLIYIPETAFDAFTSATGGTLNSTTGIVQFDTAPTGTFSFTIAGTTFPLTPAQYLIPESQYANFGLADGYSYTWINNGGSISAGVDFIIGQKFMENYYAVFDTTNSQVGFATSAS